MTTLDRYTARQALIRRISDGVVASYIHDIATPAPGRARSRSGTSQEGVDERAECLGRGLTASMGGSSFP
jgi:hypothetical protein